MTLLIRIAREFQMCNWELSSEIYVPSVWHTTFDLWLRTHITDRTHSWLRFKQSKCVFVALISNPTPSENLWSTFIYSIFGLWMHTIDVSSSKPSYFVSYKGSLILANCEAFAINDKKIFGNYSLNCLLRIERIHRLLMTAVEWICVIFITLPLDVFTLLYNHFYGSRSPIHDIMWVWPCLRKKA